MGAIDVLCGILSLAVGVLMFAGTQIVAKGSFGPIMDACMDAEKFAKTDLHAYEPWLGGPLVCLLTNFLHDLANCAEGRFCWLLVASLIFPTCLALNTEAYRAGAKGLVRYPTVISLLYQTLAVCVAIPLFWVPSYIWGGNRDGRVCVPISAALLLSLPFSILSTLVFTLDTSSHAWTLCAGFLGGPALALFPLFLWPMASSADDSPSAKARSARALARAYDITGLLALACYLVNLYQLTQAYGFDFALAARKAWPAGTLEGNGGAAAFMVVDSAGLYIGMLLFIAVRGAADVAPAVLLLPFLGPGAACAVALARQERRAASRAESENVKQA